MLQLIDMVLGVLPGAVRRRIPRVYVQLLAQMVQFGFVGVVGFGVDTAIVYAVRDGAGLYVAGAVAYAGAVTTTWWLNRIWTFRGIGNIGPAHRQWLRFVVAMLPGLGLNLGSYFVLVTVSALCATHPVIAIAVGALAGMTANFVLSRAVVFR